MINANNIIGIIKDGKENLENPIIRYASRGIVIKDGFIALINKTKKNEYKLPGGGIEDSESREEAFYREILEETGCEVEIIDNLGIIIEEKTLTNFRQISYVFVAKVIRDTNHLNLTKKEEDEGLNLLWVPAKEALRLIKDSIEKVRGSEYDSRYRSKFMVKRDTKIVEHYLSK